MSDYRIPSTGEIVPAPDRIESDGAWYWDGDEGEPFPMTGEIGGCWTIMYCPLVGGQPTPLREPFLERALAWIKKVCARS